MRVLSIDYGLKRVGIAISDPGGSMAFPRPALAFTSGKALADQLARMAGDEQVEAIVLGLPLSLGGEETERCRQVRNLGNKLAARAGLPVHYVDERLSSYAAQEQLHDAGLSTRHMKDKIDSQAAVVILETFLNQPPQGVAP